MYDARHDSLPAVRGPGDTFYVQTSTASSSLLPVLQSQTLLFIRNIVTLPTHARAENPRQTVPLRRVRHATLKALAIVTRSLLGVRPVNDGRGGGPDREVEAERRQVYCVSPASGDQRFVKKVPVGVGSRHQSEEP